ncbi:hypothetical protein FRB99_000401 [Tulasnella sp. 403]|nr:hypothetical protein FRB99_000401 [Tulasnella sp. 403]
MSVEPPAYVEIPPYASLIRSRPISPPLGSRPPTPIKIPSQSTPLESLNTPSANGRFNVPSMLLSQALSSLPSPLPSQGQVRRPDGQQVLASARDPLSLPIMTANFRRFIGKCGPVFWLQDRVEEVVMWRKGTAYTGAWIAAYVFLCYYPRLMLLLPQFVLLHILFTNYRIKHPENEKTVSTPSTAAADMSSSAQPPEGTPDWFANLQAIQNLMGIFCDVYDFLVTQLEHLTWTTPLTQAIFLLTLFSILTLLPLLPLIPLRPLFLTLGLTLFTLTHPSIQPLLPTFARLLTPHIKRRLQRIIDNDRLRKQHWAARLSRVSVWENQRWSAATGTWSYSHLRSGDRKAWTPGEEAWLSDDSIRVAGSEKTISDLSFTLPPGWKFVETEGWIVDLLEGWQILTDQEGWIYTNDSWVDPQPMPPEEWRVSGMTRRRKWAHRIYYTSS